MDNYIKYINYPEKIIKRSESLGLETIEDEKTLDILGAPDENGIRDLIVLNKPKDNEAFDIMVCVNLYTYTFRMDKDGNVIKLFCLKLYYDPERDEFIPYFTKYKDITIKTFQSAVDRFFNKVKKIN